MKATFAFLLMISLIGVLSPVTADGASPCDRDRYLIVPGQCVGRINASTTFHNIRTQLRGHVVRPELLPVGEGFVHCVSVVDSGTPSELFVTWATDPSADVEWQPTSASQETQRRTQCAKIDFGNAPAMEVDVRARLDGEAASDPELLSRGAYPWHSAQGIRIGLSLRRLRRIVPGTFTVSGLGWDYGGMIRISPDFSLTTYYSEAKFDRLSHQQQESISGERELSPSDPALNTLDPVISGISVRIAPHT